MNATVEPFELRLDPPLRTARETLQTRRGFVFAVEDGQTGFGDATPLEPFTESLADTRRALERAETAFDSEGWPGAFRVVSETRDGRLRFPAARHAVSLAALDSSAKGRKIPLYRLLGGKNPAQLSVNATVGDGSPADTAETAFEAQQAGFPAIKVKVGAGSVERDVDRVRAVRERVDSTLEFRVDANGAWTRAEAEQFLTAIMGLDIAYLEQPLAVEHTLEHGALCGSGTRIALDESLSDWAIQPLLENDVADVYVLKPMALGGIDVARGLARSISDAGKERVVTSIFESVIGRTAAVHLAMSLEGLPAAGLATAARFQGDLAPDPTPVRDGGIEPPIGAGLGIEKVTLDG